MIWCCTGIVEHIWGRYGPLETLGADYSACEARGFTTFWVVGQTIHGVVNDGAQGELSLCGCMAQSVQIHIPQPPSNAYHA